MRTTLRVTGLLLILLAAYTVWPFVDLYRLARAVEHRDVAEVGRRVEFRTLRTSLNRQLLSACLQLTGKEAKLGPMTDIAVSAVTSAADPFLADFASAERLLDLIEEGWPRVTLPSGASIRLEIVPDTLGRLWRVYASSDYRLQDFYVSAPASAAARERFRLRLRLIQWQWKLIEVELPEDLRLRFARALVKAMEREPNAPFRLPFELRR